jgi:hypothetical protein
MHLEAGRTFLGQGRQAERGRLISTLLWLLLALLYLVRFVTLALATLRRGHTVVFWFRIVVPILWIIGALISPTARAEARGPACPKAGLTWCPMRR